MSANAPAAIYSLWNAVHRALPTSELSGIVGDVNHSFGYHLCRNDLPGNDYSVTLPKDRLGSSQNASALDVKLPPDLMIVVTRRLYAAAKSNDPRLAALREYCGTTDGMHTHPYDLSNGQDGPLDSWDASHLWHIHLSFYREFSDNAAALAPIADVMAGVIRPRPSPTPAPVPPNLLEEIMALDRSSADYKALVADIAHAVLSATVPLSAPAKDATLAAVLNDIHHVQRYDILPTVRADLAADTTTPSTPGA